jgi:H+/Cl- antiporter ClcA
MSKNKTKKSHIQKINLYRVLFFRKYPALPYIIKWLMISAIVGIAVGSASAGFLISLNWVTDFRENNLWLIALLPVVSFFRKRYRSRQ